MPLLWLSLAFLAGILLAGTLNFTPAVWWACASFGAIGLLAERTFLKSNRTLDSLRAELRLPVSLLLLALAGCAHAPGRLVIELDEYRIEAGKKDGE